MINKSTTNFMRVESKNYLNKICKMGFSMRDFFQYMDVTLTNLRIMSDGSLGNLEGSRALICFCLQLISELVKDNLWEERCIDIYRM